MLSVYFLFEETNYTSPLTPSSIVALQSAVLVEWLSKMCFERRPHLRPPWTHLPCSLEDAEGPWRSGRCSELWLASEHTHPFRLAPLQKYFVHPLPKARCQVWLIFVLLRSLLTSFQSGPINHVRHDHEHNICFTEVQQLRGSVTGPRLKRITITCINCGGAYFKRSPLRREDWCYKSLFPKSRTQYN